VIELRRRQLDFGDGLIAEEVGEVWEGWMRHAVEPRSDAVAHRYPPAASPRCLPDRVLGQLGCSRTIPDAGKLPPCSSRRDPVWRLATVNARLAAHVPAQDSPPKRLLAPGGHAFRTPTRWRRTQEPTPDRHDRAEPLHGRARAGSGTGLHRLRDRCHHRRCRGPVQALHSIPAERTSHPVTASSHLIRHQTQQPV
jgi:hypothetical protein